MIFPQKKYRIICKPVIIEGERLDLTYEYICEEKNVFFGKEFKKYFLKNPIYGIILFFALIPQHVAYNTLNQLRWKIFDKKTTLDEAKKSIEYIKKEREQLIKQSEAIEELKKTAQTIIINID